MTHPSQVFPARAGMIPFAASATFKEEGIPRESGDDPRPVVKSQIHNQVFPARAGMIRSPADAAHGQPGIPRESGDDPYLRIERRWSPEYSPRERG